MTRRSAAVSTLRSAAVALESLSAACALAMVLRGAHARLQASSVAVVSVPESVEERQAREAVEAHLKVPVRRFEDGTANWQVDALIETPAGDYPLEVVGDHYVDDLRLAKALQKYGYIVPGHLSHDWYVRLRSSAKVRDLHRRIVSLLPDPATALEPGGVAAPPELAALGVRTVAAFPNDLGNGVVTFMTRVEVGSAGYDALGAWASQFLQTQPDVALKLERHGGDERHAFVWAEGLKSMAAQFQLLHGPAPELPPKLPAGVTHLWVGAQVSGHEVLHWSPSLGWVATGWRVPLELERAGG